jgi:hypothetical protein
VISSEIFTDGDDDAVRRVVADLVPARVHVVVTLRPLTRILASQWQQAVKGGLRVSFDGWLREIFDGDGAAAARFWRRHRHDRLLDRWASEVGHNRVTVVVVDERDHGFALRAFERLLGLRGGTLPEVSDRANRSLTLTEVETVRAFNARFHGAGLRSPWAHRMRQRVVHGYIRRHRPSPDEPRIQAPAWAVERAGTVAREMVDAIAVSGIRVVGDLARLAPDPPSVEPAVPREPAPGRESVAPLMSAAIAVAVPAIRLTDGAARIAGALAGRRAR